MISARDAFQHSDMVLGVYITNKCNFRCSHCSNESSPEETNALDADKVAVYLRRASNIVKFQIIHVSGGEPFMNPKALDAVFKFARDNGKRVAINTNGKLLMTRGGLDQALANSDVITDLFISTSEWHEEFFSLSRVADVVRAIAEDIKFVEIIDLRANRQALKSIRERLSAEQLPDNVSFQSSLIERIGRAVFIENALEEAVEERFKVCELTKRPTIVEDGRLLICCNTINYAKGSTGLVSSDLRTPTPNAPNESFSRWLAEIGPQLMRAYMRRENAQLGELTVDPIKPETMCEICAQITMSPSQVEEIEKVFGERLEKLRSAISTLRSKVFFSERVETDRDR